MSSTFPSGTVCKASSGGYYQLDHILGSISDLDFKAVKAGDVDRTSSQVGDQAVLRQRISLDLASSHQVARTGDQIRSPSSGWPEEQIIGFQMALKRYDTTSVQLRDSNMANWEDLGPEHVYASEPGLIRFSWDNLLPRSTSPRNRPSPGLHSLESVGSSAVDLAGQVGFLQNVICGRTENSPGPPLACPHPQHPMSEDVLYSPEPNPFSDQT